MRIATCFVALLACGLACAWPSLGCGKPPAPDAAVPEDCKKWLDAYFDALKSKDAARVQDLCSAVSAKDAAMLPAEGAEGMRKSKKQFTASLMARISQDLGDFRTRSVESCKETVLRPEDPMANALGEGRHVEILCVTKYSKREAREQFILYKGPLDADFVLQSHRLSYSPF